MPKIVEPELSYRIIGCCMKVHSELGKACKEKYYQRALSIAFEKEGLRFQKEIKVDMNFDRSKIGHYFLDFLVENKIVVELKSKPFLNTIDVKQVLEYLNEANLRLGIIVNFGKDSLEQKRIINKNYKSVREN